MNLLCPRKKKAALKNCSAEGCTRMGLGRTSERKKALFRDMQLLRKRSGSSIRLPLLLVWGGGGEKKKTKMFFVLIWWGVGDFGVFPPRPHANNKGKRMELP